jgi:hypothetical protein
MSQIRSLHQQAMDLAEAATVARLRGALELAAQFTRQAFEQETQAAALTLIKFPGSWQDYQAILEQLGER